MRAVIALVVVAVAAGAAVAGIAVSRRQQQIAADEPGADDVLTTDSADVVEAEEVPSSTVTSSPRLDPNRNTAAGLVALYGLPVEVAQAIVDVAREVGASASHLAAYLHWRTAGVWDPAARSGAGFGLMGWRSPPQAIMVPGVSAAQVMRMGALEQIQGPIRAHLLAGTSGTLFDVPGAGSWASPFRPYVARPVRSLHSLAMTMAFPLYREEEDVDATFPLDVATALGVATPRALVAAIRAAAPAGAV